MRRPTFSEFKKKALENPEVKKEYDRLKPIFEKEKLSMKRKLTKRRNVVIRLETKKSNMLRIKSLNNKLMPTIKTFDKSDEITLNSQFNSSRFN